MQLPAPRRQAKAGAERPAVRCVRACRQGPEYAPRLCVHETAQFRGALLARGDMLDSGKAARTRAPTDLHLRARSRLRVSAYVFTFFLKKSKEARLPLRYFCMMRRSLATCSLRLSCIQKYKYMIYVHLYVYVCVCKV